MSQKQNIKPVIYFIKNKINKRVYVGSAINWQRRKIEHKKLLKNNKHPNRFLQNDFNRSKMSFEQTFSFEIKEIVLNVQDLLMREQYYLDLYYDNQNMCYNLASKAYSVLGVKWPEYSRKTHSSRRKGNGNPMWGKAHNKKTRQKMAEKQQKKVKQFLLNGVFVAEYSSISEAADFVGLSRQMIGLCCNGERKTGKGFIWRFFNEKN